MSRALGRLASRLGAVPGVRAASWARPGQPSPFRPVPAPALPRRGLLDHKPLEEYGEYANRIIDGKGISDQMLHDIGEKVKDLVAKGGRAPGLGIILVGDDARSGTYVKMKEKGWTLSPEFFELGNEDSLNEDSLAAAHNCGFRFELFHPPKTATKAQLEAKIKEWATDEGIDGMIIQLPLPEHLDATELYNLVPPEKDVDGLHPLNAGLLAKASTIESSITGNPFFVPCTPFGVLELLDRTGVQIEGKNAVVVGRSNVVGLPMAVLLTKRSATVTIAHSKTQNLADVIRQADIVVAAAGKAAMIKGSWIKPGATVIDVGTTPVKDETKKAGFHLQGDVDFNPALQFAGKITPVPGGVGPMTVAMLIRNTLQSALLKQQRK